MKHKQFTFFGLLLIAAMLVTACASATTAAPTTAPTTAAQPTTPPATSAPATATTVVTTTVPMTATATAAATVAPATPVVTSTQATTGTGSTAASCPLTVESGAKITFSGWGDATEQKIYRDSIDRFTAVCTGVSVDYVPIPTNFQDKMKAEMAGGTAPDVFYVDSQLMSAFASTNQLLPLDSYMSQAGVSASDFIPALMTEFQLNGKTYGLPKDWGTLGLIYLPDAFTNAGIPEPTNDWTWDDMRNAAKAIQAKGKYAGFCMGTDEARFAPFVFSNGGTYTSPDYKTAMLNTPEVKTEAQFVADMFKEKSLVRPADIGASWCGEAIGKQLVAMTTEGGWMVNFMKQTYPNVNYKAVEIPKGNKTRADYIFTNALGVNANTKFPIASAALAIFITGKANQAAIVSTGFAYSTHPDQANLISNPIDQAISAGGLLPDSKVQYWGVNTGKVEDSISKALERVFLGDQTVDESFNQAQQEVTAALSGQ